MLGSRIRELREARGLSQTQLAKSLGVTPAAVSNWETIEGRGPSRDVLPRLAAMLSVSIDALFASDDEQPQVAP